MKNKIVYLGTICLILALGLVIAGCKDEGLQAIELDSMSSPNNVTAKWVAEVTTPPASVKNAHILVTWDTVSDASSYGIVFSQEGKKNYSWLNSADNGIKTETSSTSPTQNDDGSYTVTVTHTLDMDKCQAEVFYPSWDHSADALIKNYGGLDLKIGVIAYSRNSEGKYQSDPAWAKDLVKIPNTYKQSY